MGAATARRDLKLVAVAWLRHRQPLHCRNGSDVMDPDIHMKNRHVIATSLGGVDGVDDAAAFQELDGGALCPRVSRNALDIQLREVRRLAEEGSNLP
jgi:hypothetical protein